MKKNLPKIIITGSAGFIGSALSIRLLKEGYEVVGIDNLNNYYDVALKLQRLNLIENIASIKSGSWKFHKLDLEDMNSLENIFSENKYSNLVHLAAQAGVRYSLKNPLSYINSNLLGFGNILECCRKYKISNFIYASSSSVYGGNTNIPFHEDQETSHPLSLYGATKRSNELMAHSYSHLYSIPTIGLRFFTVYGPWGRPDMAPFIFANSILNNKEIKIYNHGKMKRDFTFIDDIVEAIFLCLKKPAEKDLNFNKKTPTASTSFAPHMIFNIGNSKTIELMDFIKILEENIGKSAKKVFMDLQPGDVISTEANVEKLEQWINFTPKISIDEGVKIFSDWYINYFNNENKK